MWRQGSLSSLSPSPLVASLFRHPPLPSSFSPGTPLQNSLEELRALLEFLMPSLFIDPDHPDHEVDSEVHMRKLEPEVREGRGVQGGRDEERS